MSYTLAPLLGDSSYGNTPYVIDTTSNPQGVTYTSVLGVSGDYNKFPVVIVDKSMQINAKRETGSQAKISFFCLYEDHGPLINYLLYGNTQTIGGLYRIWLGAVHPEYANFYCTDVIATPVEPNIGQLEWTFAKLECTYEPYVFSLGSPSVIREDTLELSGQVINIPGKYLSFGSGDHFSSEPQNLYYPLMRYSVKLLKVNTLPIASVLACMNTVNSTDLTLQLGGDATTTVSAGFALYEGIGQTKVIQTTGGSKCQDITHTWLISPINFNYIIDWTLFDTSTNVTTNYGTAPDVFVQPDQTIYQSADHAGLLGI